MKPGSKYHPLFEYLQRQEQETVSLSFSDIEMVMDSLLPASARTRKNWWSNRDSASALQAGAWIRAGYHVEAVDLHHQMVTFQKFQADYHVERQGDEIVWRQDAIKALRKHMGLTQAEFAQQLGVRRQTVSEWENGVYDPDRSTTKFLELIAKQAHFDDQLRDDQL
jgi:DNA-binding transcriptional regulator YiaG